MTAAAETRVGIGRHVFLLVTFVVTLGTVVATVAWPTAPTRPIHAVLAALLLITAGLGPYLRGARPGRRWAPVPVAILLALSAIVLRETHLTIGPVRLPLVLSLLSYLTISGWLLSLMVSLGRRTAVRALLDTAAVASAVALTLWTGVTVDSVDRVLPVVLWAVYPVIDVVNVSLSAHLAMRLRRRLPAWWFMLAAEIVCLILDTIWAVTGRGMLARRTPTLSMSYVFAYWFLAAGALHPSITRMSERFRAAPEVRSHRLRVTLIALGLAPAVVSMGVSVESLVDGLARSILTALLLVLMFARLSLSTFDLARTEAESRRRAAHDDLTGLLNRDAMISALEARLAASGPGATAVLFLDCDDFKHVNDTWGHPAGDAVLRAVAERLPEAVRDGDLVARHGGDEFLVAASVADATEALRLASRIHDLLTRPIPVLPGRLHTIHASIGIALARPGDGLTPTDVIGRADIALYEAKVRHRDVVYDADLDQRTRRRAAMAERLRTAVADGGIGILLQPIVDCRSPENVIAWEALARWHDPELGDVPPDDFVPLAEELGLIHDIGRTVLRQACRELARLRQAPRWQTMAVSVNVSPAQLTCPEFPEVVADALRDADLPSQALWLEITESLIIDPAGGAVDTIQRLHEAGLRICLDDYGSGYASLSTLRRLPIDCVKIDKSLIDTAQGDPHAIWQLRSLLDLLRSLRVAVVVVEGIESEAQHETVRAAGSPLVQGWFYGRPATADHWLTHDPVRP